MRLPRKPRLVSLSVAAVLVATMSGGPVTAVDIDSPGDLCQVLSAEEINSLSPIEFGEGAALRWQGCSFAVPTDDGRDGIYLTLLFGVSIDDVTARYDDEVEVEVAGRLGVAQDSKRDGYFLYVPADEHVLQVNVKLTEATQAEGVDQRQLAADVASIAAPNLEAAIVELKAAETAEADTAAAEGSLAPPPDVEGMEWSGRNITSGQDLMQDEAQAAIWQPLLDATGAEASQLVLLNTRSFDGDRQRLGQYDAIQVAGSDGATFRTALLDWMRAAGGDDIGLEDVSVGGKDVVKMTVGGEGASYLYFDGDTAHAVTLPEDLAAEVIEALP